jgi:CRISPR system Cascade subunit CasD
VTRFLLFTLYAPLASWGDIAVGEFRGSWDRPSRSAVLGLLAAALGVDREDAEAHAALEAGLGMGVRLDAGGTPLLDYHTAQTVAERDVRRTRPKTRAALLASGDHHTILSRRGYRQDAVATVAVWLRPRRGPARWSLEELAEALRRPRFVLFAGRKANALGAPLAPQVLESLTLAAAFAARPPAPAGLAAERLRLGMPWGQEVSHDPCEGFESGLDPLRREVRRDRPTDRSRWHFAEREVEVGRLRDTGSEGVPHG